MQAQVWLRQITPHYGYACDQLSEYQVLPLCGEKSGLDGMKASKLTTIVVHTHIYF